MDWATRTVLSWRLSNTQDRAFCREALQEALARYGRPEIFTTDQGSQFTSREFTEVLEQAGVAISMDGKGRWMDNVFIERPLALSSNTSVSICTTSRMDGKRVRHLASWLRYYNERAASFQPGRGPDAYGRIHPAQGGMNREGDGVDNLPRAGGLSCTQQNGDPAESERRSRGTPRTRRKGQQINHNESTLILLPGCPKNGDHLLLRPKWTRKWW